MSKTDVDEIGNAVEAKVALYFWKQIKTIIIIAFLAGVWATTLQIQVSKQSELLKQLREDTEARIRDWNVWRNEIDDYRHLGARFTLEHYETAARLFNAQKPPVPFPSYYEILRSK